MICMRRRMRAQVAGLSVARSTPSKRTVPSVGVSRRSTLRPTVVLPLPDSPTSPSVSPAAISNDTPSTALIAIAPRAKKPPPRKVIAAGHRLDERGLMRDALARPSRRHDDPGATGSSSGRTVMHVESQPGSADESGSRWATDQAVALSRGSASGERVGASSLGIEAKSPRVYGCAGCANSAGVGADSTMRPAYITSTRSARPATMPRSCVIRSTAIPARCECGRAARVSAPAR